jgi:hypothetical protein
MVIEGRKEAEFRIEVGEEHIITTSPWKIAQDGLSIIIF